MSRFADKYNKGSKYTFRTPETHKFESLVDLFNNNGADNVYTVRALFINKKSKFGNHPVVVTTDELIGLPKHLTDTVEEMIKDSELTEAINGEKFGFTITPYDKEGKTYYSVTWLDI